MYNINRLVCTIMNINDKVEFGILAKPSATKHTYQYQLNPANCRRNALKTGNELSQCLYVVSLCKHHKCCDAVMVL